MKGLKGCHTGEGTYFFATASESRTGSSGDKLQEGRLQLDIRKKWLTVREVQPQNRLPLEGGGGVSLAGDLQAEAQPATCGVGVAGEAESGKGCHCCDPADTTHGL